jgi:hypothetical protein
MYGGLSKSEATRSSGVMHTSSKLSYCSVRRGFTELILSTEKAKELKYIFREYLRLVIIVDVGTRESVTQIPPWRASRYAGMDVIGVLL